MKLKNGAEYIKSLRKINPKVYYKGERIKDVSRHPATAPHVRAAAMTYALASDKEHRELATATSHLTGHTISRFTHVHQNIEDLIKKIKLLRVLGQKTGTCFQRCVGFDGINATYSVVYEIDKKLDTDYFERFKKWLTYIQDENLMVVGAMTDPKGDRSRGIVDQIDPDQYVHVVERRENGVVIRGAKLHMTGVPVLEFPEEEWDRIINTNLKGYFLVAKAVVPQMIESGYGKVINMSSILGTVALPNQLAYASSKGGIDQMTKVMALEWAKKGICVNAIAPTYFETELVSQIRNDPERFDFINERTPMGRWGYLHELEGIVIFLAAPASDFITGQTMYIDGGWTTW